MEDSNRYTPERPFKLGDMVTQIEYDGRVSGPARKITEIDSGHWNDGIRLEGFNGGDYDPEGYERGSRPVGAHIEHWTQAHEDAVRLSDKQSECSEVPGMAHRHYWWATHLTEAECDLILPVMRRIRDEHGDDATSGRWGRG